MEEVANKQGWVEIRTGIWKSWKKRYFVLKCTSIFYFESDRTDTNAGDSSANSTILRYSDILELTKI